MTTTRHINRQSVTPRRGHYAWGAILFTLLFVYGSFVPLEFKAIGLTQAIERFGAVPYLRLDVYSRADFVANLLLLVPIGYLWVGALDTDRRDRLVLAVGLPCVIAILGVAIVGVEFAQLWFPRRTVSQNDMIAESIGAGLGMVGWFLIGRRTTAWLRRFFDKKTGAADWTIGLLRLYTVGLLIYMMLPLDLAISPEELRRKFEAGRVSLVPFSAGYANVFHMLWQIGVDAILYMPIGMGMRLGRLRPTRSLAVAVAMTVGFVMAVESLQLFIFSRSVDATDVIVGGAGGAVGAWVAGHWQHASVSSAWRGSSLASTARVGWGLLAGGLYAVPLIASFWYPFDWMFDPQQIRVKLHAFLDYPFERYYWGQEFVTLVNLARGLMLFIPLGAIVRWTIGPRAAWPGWLVLLIVVVMLGLVIEFGQTLTVSGVCDVTDVGVYLIGATVGWITIGRLLRNEQHTPGT